MGAVKGAPLYETFCVFPPAGGDQVGEAVDTPGACAMILIRAPPTMACGTIRRVVLENEKQIQKTANMSTATKTAATAAATKTSNAATTKTATVRRRLLLAQ